MNWTQPPVMPSDSSVLCRKVLVAPCATNSGSSTNSPIASPIVNSMRDGEGALAHRHALTGGREGAGAHQPSGADDERLIEHDDAPEERGAGEAVAVQDAVERLLGAEDLTVRAPHGDADRVAPTHEHALHEGLAAVGEAGHGVGGSSGGQRPADCPSAASGAEVQNLRGALEALLEALDLAGGVHDRLLARVERVAVGAHVHAQRGPGGADR